MNKQKIVIIILVIGIVIESIILTLSFVFEKKQPVDNKTKDTTNKKTGEKVTIAFDTLGGEEIEPITVEKGSTIHFPSTNKDGYFLFGWSIDGLLVDESHKFESDTLLSAEWYAIAEDKETMKIIFDANGGIKVNSLTVECGEKLNLPRSSTKEGYEFAGWTDENGKSVTNKTKLECKDITLYAEWVKPGESKKKKNTSKKQKNTETKNPVKKCPKGYTISSTNNTICYKNIGDPIKYCGPYNGYSSGTFFDMGNGLYGCAYGSEYVEQQTCEKNGYIWNENLPNNQCWLDIVNGDTAIQKYCESGTLYKYGELGENTIEGCYKLVTPENKCESGYTLTGAKCIKTNNAK